MNRAANVLKLPAEIENKLPALSDLPVTRTLAAGTLVAGVALLLTGKRKAGIAVAAAGTAMALLEDPEALERLWAGMPGYVKGAQHFLGRMEDFVEDLGKQGEHFRKLLKERV